MSKLKKRVKRNDDSNMVRIYPNAAGLSSKVHETFATQAITDPTNRYEAINAVKPSDTDVEESRDWVNNNQK